MLHEDVAVFWLVYLRRTYTWRVLCTYLQLMGSPRKVGNTESMLQKVLEPLESAGWETELYQLGGKKIRGCMACMKCWENKDSKCVVDNDKLNEVYEKMVRADAVVIGSPTYFADVSAEIKALIDRAGMVALANDRQFEGKIGGGSSCCAPWRSDPCL